MKRTDLPFDVWLTVVSAGRPHSVQQMAALIGPATWYVPAREMEDYEKAGARCFPGGGLMDSRNVALEHAFEKCLPCVQVSDDLTKIQQAVKVDEHKNKAVPSSFSWGLERMGQAVVETGAYFAGVAPTANAFYYSDSRPVSSRHFIVGDLMLVMPSSPRFDARLRLKEDYDFTLQHLTAYGKVARCNDVLATFKHRSNKGGAVAYRTAAAEQEAIAYLKAKWPGSISDNPRRPNEILMRWKTQ